MSSKYILGRMERAAVNSLLLSGMVLLVQWPAFATQSVTLAWNPSTDPTVVGYNLYYGGKSGNYTNTLSAGNATNKTVSGLVEGKTYYFAATTYNSSGIQSPFSNEVSYSVPTNSVAVNQPPTLNPINNLTINENAGPQTVNLSGITSGAANENQVLTVTATSGNTGLIPNPTVNYTSANTNGSLTFTPVANANGSAIITVTVNDGGASNNIVTRTFTVKVNSVNQAPTLNPLSNLTLNENAGPQSVNLAGITSGAANENQTLTVTAASGNTNLVPKPTVSYTSPRTNGSLTFTPVTKANGSTTVTVTVNDGGASNNIITRAFTVTVNPVNQPPTLNPINNLTINENAGPQSVNLSGITSGAANENQTLTVTAASSNTNLVPNPTVNYLSASTNGSLTFKPVTNVTGSASITVTVNDGGASNNIVTQTFTVTVQVSNDHTAPSDQITAPTSNQQSTNGTFTVTGKASDNVAVDTVYYSLNGSAWAAATTVNNWTNWSANVTLTPGYNTIQAYAADTAGNLSTTNAVKFVYLAYQPLTVNIHGNGSANPNYNGKLLAVNLTYSMNASAQGGSMFTNWTDGSATVITNRSSLQFIMRTNLILTANFVDVQRPNLNIVTPTSNQQWTNGTFTATGKASDNFAVDRVVYSLNGSAWAAATTVNNWTNWTANLTLTPGYNTIQAYAADTAGNLSTTNTVKFVYLAYQPLTVNIRGNGSANPNYNGKLLAVNLTYSMNASAQGGSMFTNWTDGSATVITNRSSLQFIMRTNLILTANFVDVQRPNLNIVTPTSNQQWTNGAFTVTGKASDNVAVGTVHYSLNGGTWTAAATANAWTNWSANVTLTPGYNTIQAYAADTAGNLSTTNTVKFVYLAYQPLTVNIHGSGSANPNYNGKLLAVNMTYSMNASAQGGSMFTNWTDGSATVITNRSSLQFIMRTNLILTANFVDVQRPNLNIVTPTSNQQWTNGTFTVTGKAGDNVAVSTVYYSLNGSGWTTATTANSWTNWTANLTLTPGTNTVQAYALDTSGNFSTTNTVRFLYLVLKPLTVQIFGLGVPNPKWGSLNPNYTNGTPLAINVNYALTANPQSGFAFTNWTDGVGTLLTNRSRLQFTMVTNLSLRANFVDVTKPTLEHCHPDVQPAMDQWHLHRHGQSRRQRGREHSLLFVERFGLGGCLDLQFLDQLDGQSHADARHQHRPGLCRGYHRQFLDHQYRQIFISRAQAADGPDLRSGRAQSQVGLAQSQLHQWHAAGHQRQLRVDRQSAVRLRLHQLDRRVRQSADQPFHAPVHHGDQPLVAGQFCGCDQTDVEHRHPDVQPAMDQRHVHGHGQSRRQRGREHSLLFVEQRRLDSGRHHQQLDQLDGQSHADAGYQHRPGLCRGYHRESLDHQHGELRLQDGAQFARRIDGGRE